MELLRQLIKRFWFILIISVGLGQTLKLENNEDGTWNLIYASPLAIAGFQFNVDNATVDAAYGGGIVITPIPHTLPFNYTFNSYLIIIIIT